MGSINMTVGGLTNQMNRPQNMGSTPFQLSINLNIQVNRNQFKQTNNMRYSSMTHRPQSWRMVNPAECESLREN